MGRWAWLTGSSQAPGLTRQREGDGGVASAPTRLCSSAARRVYAQCGVRALALAFLGWPAGALGVPFIYVTDPVDGTVDVACE